MPAAGIKIPPSFDADFYRKDKASLQSDDAAYDHFRTIGKRQGLRGSPACDQGYLLRFVQSLNAELMLEIGPGCSPKLKGANVRYFDVKSKAELQHRYKNDPAFAAIPNEIHYTEKSGFLGGIKDKFDVAFSSHAIEHTLDLISHLNEVEALLKANGLYVLVVPNKNFTFDYFKPVTTLEDVLAAHFDGQRAPSLSLRAMLFEVNRRTHNSPLRHWQNDHGNLNFDPQNLLGCIKRFNHTATDSVAASGYHNWIFTEENFTEIIDHLHEMRLIPLKTLSVYNTPHGGMSFSAILGR